MSTTFACDTCYDTHTIDAMTDGVWGEVVCPDCTPNVVTIKISGLGHGLGARGAHYHTAIAHTGSSITFRGTPNAIRQDVRGMRLNKVSLARIAGERGRNSISSGAIAIERRVLAALAVAK